MFLLLFAGFRPCQDTIFKTQISNLVPNVAEKLFNVAPGEGLLIVSPGSTERTLVETKLMTSAFDLISSVGGNLGLFLGFSLIATLYAIYELCENMLTR